MTKIKNVSYILIVALLIFIICGGILSYSLNKKEPVPISKKEGIKKEEVQKKEDVAPPVISTPPEEVWKTYTSPELGFSIKYPEMVYGIHECSSDKVIWVPVKVFEDNENGVVYISQEYYYDDWDKESRTKTGPCEKITYSLESFRNQYKEWKERRDSFAEQSRGLKPRLGWAIIIKTVKNEDELDKFIKENYGPGCYAKDKKVLGIEREQSGVYNILIKGESDNMETTLGTTSCVGAWIERYKVLYFPEKNKVMSVILGQEPTFWNNPHTPPYQAYDEKMIDSFRFN